MLEEQATQSGDACIAVQVCCDDERANATDTQLIEKIGFAPQELGDLADGTLVEPGAPLYNKNLLL